MGETIVPTTTPFTTNQYRQTEDQRMGEGDRKGVNGHSGQDICTHNDSSQEISIERPKVSGWVRGGGVKNLRKLRNSAYRYRDALKIFWIGQP